MKQHESVFLHQYITLLSTSLALCASFFYFTLALVSYEGDQKKSYESNFFIIGVLTIASFAFGLVSFILAAIYFRAHLIIDNACDTNEFFSTKFTTDLLHTLLFLAALIVAALCTDDACVWDFDTDRIFWMAVVLLVGSILSQFPLYASYHRHNEKHIDQKIVYKLED